MLRPKSLRKDGAADASVPDRSPALTLTPRGGPILRELCGDIVELRRGDHSAERLKIERERVELERERSEQQVREKAEELLKQPEVKARLNGGAIGEEERVQRLREIFGISNGEAYGRGLSAEALAEIETSSEPLMSGGNDGGKSPGRPFRLSMRFSCSSRCSQITISAELTSRVFCYPSGMENRAELIDAGAEDEGPGVPVSA